jgi:hypothetical protein
VSTTTRPPATYGYRHIYDAHGSYVTRLPVEPQASIVREIISRIARHQSISRVRRELESRNVPTPRGGANWSWTVIRAIARNPAYIGKDTDTPHTDQPATRWTPIVTNELFFAAQEALAEPDDAPPERHAADLSR